MIDPSRRMSAQIVFPFAAFLSGVTSGISYFVPGGAIIFPGIFFGIAMAYAVRRTVEVLHPAFTAVLILFSAFGFWAACITALITFRLTDGRNNFVGTSIAAMFAGCVGASLAAFGLAIATEHFPLMRVVPVMALSGAVCGGAIFPVTIRLHDIGYLPHPLDFILAFVMWQVGVASVAPMSLKAPFRG